MSGPLKKPPPSGATPSGRTPSANPTSNPGASPARSPSRTSTSASTPANGVARSRSVRGANGSPVSARAAVKRPAAPSGLSSSSTPSLDAAEEEDARIENAALVDDLKERLQKAEQVSEEFQRQVEVLQSKLDDAIKDQGKLEDRMHEEEERVEMLENEKRESQRQRNELERIFEAERVSVMKDKEDSQAREEELHEVIQRLKENLAQRDNRPGTDEDGRLARQCNSVNDRTASFPSPTTDTGHFAPPTSIQRSNSRNNSKLLLQKDKVIESLRLELAEAQVKLIEMENMGGTRIHEVERALMETRMTNARLMEENESFQVLLSDKTLNGDFSPAHVRRVSMEDRTPSRSGPGTSLADELGDLSPSEVDAEHTRRLEAEVNTLKDQNKALTLYINKIIERLLQHQGFESVLSNAQEGPHGISATGVEKELPPVPPPKDKENEPAPQGQTFLQRARSVVAGPNKARPRPQSQMAQTGSPPRNANLAPTVNENPETAPSIPLGRSQSVSQGKRISGGGLGLQTRAISGNTLPGAAGIVNSMYKPPADQISPNLASPTRASTSFFALPTRGENPNAAARIPSGSQAVPSDEPGRDAALAALTGTSESSINDSPSPPRSVASSQDRPQTTVFAGKQVRQLRLVQQSTDAAAEEARLKAANRGSWIGGVTGWFGKKEQAEQQQ
ncbi:hypothetical protein NA57DRAFT_20669, partial [Rhizodiscina lignyota]